MIVHSTPGLIDIRSFTTFGVNAKPNTRSPIGYFGTGLKYAIAVLVREGLQVTVWIGTEPHEFYCEPTNFRGRDLSLIRMRRQRGLTRRWWASDLPFTTELGKNWKLWMALREIHSNTLDEGGATYRWFVAEHDDHAQPEGVEGLTRIVVRGDAYAQEYAGLGKIFLQGRGDPQNGVCILDQGSQHGYYRGMRVLELPRPSLLTYSVETSLTLTEDRTVSNWMWDHYVRHAIMGLTDEDMIRRVLRAGDETYESRISWDSDEYSYCTPEFLRCVSIYGRKPTWVFVHHERQERIRSRLSWRRTLLNALDEDNDARLLAAVRASSSLLRSLLESTYTPEERGADAQLVAEAAEPAET